VIEINKAMIQLNQITNQNTAASQESSAAAERLGRQATQLRASVQMLKNTLEGQSGSRTS
jgi:methyl-accepting chemotaxis protein